MLAATLRAVIHVNLVNYVWLKVMTWIVHPQMEIFKWHLEAFASELFIYWWMLVTTYRKKNTIEVYFLITNILQNKSFCVQQKNSFRFGTSWGWVTDRVNYPFKLPRNKQISSQINLKYAFYWIFLKVKSVTTEMFLGKCVNALGLISRSLQLPCFTIMPPYAFRAGQPAFHYSQYSCVWLKISNTETLGLPVCVRCRTAHLNQILNSAI